MVEQQNSDPRVDASDVDTDISSRLIIHNICILVRTCLFACLMLSLPRCTHAPLHSREQACLVRCESDLDILTLPVSLVRCESDLDILTLPVSRDQ